MPSAAELFSDSVYDRGAMTLQALRVEVGDATFFRILRDWFAQHRYGNATTAEFIALAERDSHRNLRGFFCLWLFKPGRVGTANPAAAPHRQRRSRRHSTGGAEVRPRGAGGTARRLSRVDGGSAGGRGSTGWRGFDAGPRAARVNCLIEQAQQTRRQSPIEVLLSGLTSRTLPRGR